MNHTVGRDSSVGSATRYGLDGPGIETRCGREFSHMSVPALGPNQTPVCAVSGPFTGGKVLKRGVNHPPYLEPRLKKK